MKHVQFWQERTPKEQKWLVVGCIMIVLGIAYHLVWSPLSSKAANLKQSNLQKQQLYEWMQDNQDLAKDRGSRPNSNKPLFALAQSYFKSIASDKPPTINRLNQNAINMTIERVAFDDFILKLENFATQEGVSVEQLLVRKTETQGIVSIRCTLSK